MALKEMLLQMDSTPQCAARLDLAIALARQHGASLTGIYVITHQHYAPQNESAQQRSAEAEALFTKRTAESGIEARWQSVEWNVSGVGVSEIILMYAYYYDLIIVGQPEDGSFENSDFPDRIILGSGRPVLVVPYAGRFTGVGDSPMIAWRAGRESVRAVNDAFPFLERARQICLITITSEPVSAGEVASSWARMSAHLAKHGLEVKAKQLTSPVAMIGDLLINAAIDEGADLLVAGANDPTRRGYPMLGVVVRHLLRHSPVPLLLSH
jgi:nucleotide-binding universal stress UspA family protein